jgi:PPK2 family polyphosphate:nucleotide phosphotransferase
VNPDDYKVAPGQSVILADRDPGDIGGIASKEEGKALLKVERKRIRDLQERLYAESAQSLLVVLQATDTGGKDGTIKAVFQGVNPQGVRVQSFKAPTAEELAHDFLWRIHAHTPKDGDITVFNRSHYEDVLIGRVRNLVPEATWQERYEHINNFERLVATNGTRILKFFLHISREEQKERLQSRLDEPEKHWKFHTGDLAERELWDEYQLAYEAALTRCSTDLAPWYIIPANRKWARNVIVARIIADTLEAMDPQFPPEEEGLDQVVIPD